ncbi:hypothetical protein BH24CHL5_BH24CHL5_12810 [soil metagenome]
MAERRFALTAADESIGDQLVGWGKVALLESRGRTTGRRARAAVGFVAGSDDALFIAAGSESSDWALNLRADGRCRVTIGDEATDYLAREVEDADRSNALGALILKYGTPAERLGHGPVFRLDRQ